MTSAEKNTNRLHETLARLFVKTLFVVGALACMAPSAAITITHQIAHVQGPLAWALASVSAMSVLLAGLSPLAISKAGANWRWGRVFVCAVTFVGCISYNLATAIGAYSVSRAEQTGAASKASESVSNLKAQIDEKLSALAPLNIAAGGATAEMLKNEQDRMRVDRLWELSGECKSADGPKERAFCASYKGKGVAIKAAEKAEELEADIGALRAQMDSASKGTLPGQSADPQSANVAAVISAMGYDATSSSVGMWINLLLAVVVEVVAAFGPLILYEVMLSNDSKNTTNGGGGDGPRPGVKHAPVTEKSVMDAACGEGGQDMRRRIPDDDGQGPKPKARRRVRSAKKTHTAPLRHSLKSNDNSNVVPFRPQTPEERGKLVGELHGAGLSNYAIARQLGVSERTVRRDLIETVKHSSAGMVFAAE